MADLDWDLSAVVRSCTAAAASSSSSPLARSASSLVEGQNASDCQQQALTFQVMESIDGQSFPSLVKPSSSGVEELQLLYQPFLPRRDNNNFNCPFPGGEVRMVNPASFPRRLAPAPPYLNPSAEQEQPILHHARQQQPLQMGGHQYQPPATSALAHPPPQTPRGRKRKSQQKKKVCQVTAEQLSSDLWAWRKYGQKPIKGSPYPRNYYRCSSLKGCSARKQVEQSNTESNIFIVTYTGEHSHPRPTHRNSLAGSTRNKFTGALQKAQTSSSPHPEENPDNKSPTISLSPTTPLTAPTGNPMAEDGATRSESTEDKEISDYEADLDDVEDLLIPNITSITEDIFAGFPKLNPNLPLPNSSFGFGRGFNRH
ncbi:hypothetical protein SAY86_028978 [Trapa natans]|uniref:WRKY domain-containing protein n=1 Tax=Trapa natans TaxID=22666 RepID=A0AAN7RB99_TRANT|nr:hypothetical protein SAY86_028978 [Trapa natans]